MPGMSVLREGGGRYPRRGDSCVLCPTHTPLHLPPGRDPHTRSTAGVSAKSSRFLDLCTCHPRRSLPPEHSFAAHSPPTKNKPNPCLIFFRFFSCPLSGSVCALPSGYPLLNSCHARHSARCLVVPAKYVLIF